VPVAVLEKFDSRQAAAGDNPQAELRYVVRGTDDEQAALAAVESTSPSAYGGLVRQGWEVEPVGDGSEFWEGTVRYGRTSGAPRQVGESVFTFDTGGGSMHVTQAKEHVASYAPAGETAPDFGGAIGVTHDAVEGCDVVVPVYNWSETHYFAADHVTQGYKLTLFALTGKTSAGAFRGFATGEVLFLGASGSTRGDDTWEISFRFAASPNVTGLVIGSITGINKKGWEYMWVRYTDAEDDDAKCIVKRPASVHVERVYDAADLVGLGI
jgi:hypothetical protein